MKPLDAIRERRRRELEADLSIEPGVDFAEHAGAVQSLTRESCAASLLGLEPEFTMAAPRLVQAMRTQGTPRQSAQRPRVPATRQGVHPLKKRITRRRGPYVTWSASGLIPRARPHSLWGSGKILQGGDGGCVTTTRRPPNGSRSKTSQDLEQVKKRMSGTVVKHRVEYLPSFVPRTHQHILAPRRRMKCVGLIQRPCSAYTTQ
jgi:hypothetical protein